jgi:hypothetical protein
MLTDDDKHWIVEQVGKQIRHSVSGIDSRTRWHSSEISDLRYASSERMDRIEESLESLTGTVATLAVRADQLTVSVQQLVDALLHPPHTNGKGGTQ